LLKYKNKKKIFHDSKMSGSGGSDSITKALRTWDVDDAYAPNVFSDRFQNPSNVVCPARYQVDSYYRPASRHTLYSDDVSGCSDFEHRMNIETELRATLPMPAGEPFSYDTLGVSRDESFAAPTEDGEYYFCSGRDPCVKLSYSSLPERNAARNYLRLYHEKKFQNQ